METSSQMEIPTVMRKNPRGKNLALVAERTVPEPGPSLAELQKREAELAAKEADLRAATAFLNAAFKVLSAKILLLLAVLFSAGMFVWCVVSDPSGWKIAAACLFAVTVFLPLVIVDARSEQK